MTDEQLIRFKAAAERHTAKHLKTKESARALLIKEGIYTENGNIAPEYGGPPTRK